ncbi:DNA-binding GntR family transcriptional regulator [Mobilisporobacter senegalensis]|uniref:DNA-binding GntR family transcriptional regulator n=1 Tax=Mobilisporobacter senegalensis TaxID=1329262 RepID=A0A3N1XKG1_9FIRM|nr:GntR family transcriptional regulator [Mobilisporobacter senegalensis]ROR27156.1 DNA-binding GntR family transcriptional regulator [Mobilisporobacter senegalensis]
MYITERLAKESAREYAYRILKDNIVSLELKPGSLVSENELALNLGLSRTPVREALIELSKLRIVEIYPQRGSFISLIDSDLVEEARFLRLTFESAMIEMACDVAKETDIIELEENLKLQEFYKDNNMKEKQLQLDNEFHKLLFKINNKEFTYELFEGLMTHFDRVRSLSLNVIKDSKVYSDHRAIAEAIKKRDKVLAKEIIIKHLSRYKVDEKELRKEYPEYFK